MKYRTGVVASLLILSFDLQTALCISNPPRIISYESRLYAGRYLTTEQLLCLCAYVFRTSACYIVVARVSEKRSQKSLEEAKVNCSTLFHNH